MPVLPLPTPRTELLPLLRTLFDIALLRKGPQHIPDSLLVFGMAVGLWLFALLAGIVLVSSIDEAHFFPEILRVVALMAVYSGIVFAAGYGPRIVRTLTAIIGCGALLSVLYAILYSSIGPVIGQDFLNLMILSFVLWSLSIKGHIIANAISTKWYVGALIAAAVFVGQRFVITILSSTA